MPTINQLIKNSRKKKKKINKTIDLQKHPFKKGVCLILFTKKHKKQN
jgi:small subunit ribosomal protein S12